MIIEQPLKADIGPVYLVGTPDLYYPDRQLAVDYKTCKSKDTFIQGNPMPWQAAIYKFLLEIDGKPVRRFVYRLIPKPTIRYCNKDKDVLDYEQRCADWLAKHPPCDYEVVITDDMVDAIIEEVDDIVRSMMDGGRSTKNPQACYSHIRGVCPYLDICQRVIKMTDGDPMPRYRTGVDRYANMALDKPWVSYSTLCDYLHCQAMHKLRHISRLERRDATTSEALHLGSMFHAGIDALKRHGSTEAAYTAIADFQDSAIVTGDLAMKMRQEAAKARAMVRVVGETFDDIESNPFEAGDHKEGAK